MFEFERLFNSHKGETCTVIGNGPSLRNVPNSFLEEFPTLGSNRIYLKYIPTYYACVNDLVINQFRSDLNILNCKGKFVREHRNIRDAFDLHLIELPLFSFSPTKWLYDGHNVTFVLLQLAFFLGFKEVRLVGVDHSYVYQGEPNQVLDMEGEDPNHFDSSYFQGVKWQAPDLVASEAAYQMAREAFESNGRRIINANTESKLTVFPFEELWPA